MFKISSIEVTGFWQSKIASADFRDDVNIIIGKNGTGKTTFMNIAHAVLSVDGEALSENIFNTATLILTDGKRKRTVRAERIEPASSPFPAIVYHISNRRYVAALVGSIDGRSMPLSLRRRAAEELQIIKGKISALVSVASLSVYRIGGETDPELRERMGKNASSTVDLRLMSLMHRLTQYQLELSSAAREVSTKLQRDVLTSLLYAEQKKDRHYRLDFNEATENQNLVSTYRQLGVSGPEVSKKIQDHITAVGNAVRNLKVWSAQKPKDRAPPDVDFAAMDAFMLTRTVVEKSLEAEAKTKSIFSQVELFLDKLKSFITDKAFSFNGGELVVTTEGPLPLVKLSSGEKQLLILFIEALLQKQQPYIFLADEPELSLHIAWQRSIISAIRSLNPNAQIVVATHSPEIAGKFQDCLLNMGEILHG
ncbi:ATP-binding protein [Acidovorax sp. LjRoot118]|uniref:AAA family ATPase n=1 Tax=Acidovorax sp. LjRoot118 TaxID=3342256 RepID=UPI003ECE547D